MCCLLYVWRSRKIGRKLEQLAFSGKKENATEGIVTRRREFPCSRWMLWTVDTPELCWCNFISKRPKYVCVGLEGDGKLKEVNWRVCNPCQSLSSVSRLLDWTHAWDLLRERHWSSLLSELYVPRVCYIPFTVIDTLFLSLLPQSFSSNSSKFSLIS